MPRSLRFLFALLVACAVSGTAPVLAQQQITGTVTDAQNGESLPGASVSVPGTTVGTATDVDGNYALTIPSDTEADSLRYSFVGYQSQTVAIAGRTTIDVALAPATQMMEDIVVIGYGSVEERDVTGSVEKVGAADFNPSAAVSPEQLISGKVSGVQISSQSGAPGSETFIRIRGATSVNADNGPLFVIDGVPISNESAQAQRNPLNFLSRDAIESITVLKDASSTAIYGTRGANGVIYIETKSAEEGEARITYNGSLSASNPTSNIDVLDAEQYRSVVQDVAPSALSQLGDANTDWQEATQRTAIGQEHSISVSRGYENASIRFNAGYLDNEGVLERSSTKRINAGIKYNQSLLDDDLDIRLTLRGSKTEDIFEPGGMVGNAASFAPTQPIRDVRSPFGGFYEWETGLAEKNPVAEYILTTNEGEAYRSLGNAEVEYQIPYVDGLSARLNLGYDVSTGEREAFQPTNLKGQADQGTERAGLIERFSFTRTNQVLDAFLNYNRTFADIESKFDVTAGYSYQDFDEEYPEFTANGLSQNVLGQNSTNPVQNTEFSTTSVTEIPNRLISLFGRVNYTFKDRYLLTATVRRDGSSRFGPGNQYATFPSAALAWRIHQEPFLESFSLFDDGTISNLKLRATIGVSGNQEFEDFLYAPFYELGGPQAQAQFGSGDNALFINTIRPQAADENLKWEQTRMTTLALDVGFLEDRFNLSVEAYQSDTKDLLFPVQPPAGANLSDQVVTNIGSVENRGLELSFDGDFIQTDDFLWNASFNAALNDNELTKLRGTEGDQILRGGISNFGGPIQLIQVGTPLNAFYVFEHIEEDGKPRPVDQDFNGDGSITRADYYVDQNGDGEITQADRYVAGNPQPNWILGHSSSFRYRDIDLSFTLRANLGHQVYNNVASSFGHYGRITASQVPSNLDESVLENEFASSVPLSDVYVEDADFLRLDNITLGYTVNTLPYVEQVRVYTSVSNVFVLTGYTGTDPEVGGDDSRGIDNNIYPRSRTFTTGLSVSL